LIVAVTPNPGLDRTLEVGRLRRGELHRVARATVEPGGNGINVARVLRAHGLPTEADVWVMAPMVATPAEALAFAESARGFGLSRVGVMIEVPSGALMADAARWQPTERSPSSGSPEFPDARTVVGS
jgi:hypothetical protein